jgi:c-di-GMP-binding flagellar brake protein YcgR
MSDAENRKGKRYPFQWQVAIVFDATENQDTYHGITKDISLGGCAVLTDHNVYSEQTVTVLIQLPPENPAGRAKIVEAKGRFAYTVLSAGHQKFRCGIQFAGFKGNGRKLLTEAIARRDVTLKA